MSGEHSAAPAPPKWIVRAVTALDVLVYNLSGGRIMNSVGDCDVCIVTMKGAKTGKARRLALMHMPWRGGLLLVAAQGGSEENPGWYFNLMKNPEITVQYKGKTSSMTARLLDGEEKAAAWLVCVDYFANLEVFQQRTTRDIPVFTCE